MIAFVDESVKENIFSLGVYVSWGNERSVRDFLERLYTNFLRSYGLGGYSGELKFNSLLMRVLKSGAKIKRFQLEALLDEFSDYIMGSGYAIATVTRDTTAICRVEDDLCGFLLKLRIRRASIIKFLLVYHAIRGFRVRKILFDGGFSTIVEGTKKDPEGFRLGH